MIKIENMEIVGWQNAIRGMRNPMNSWDRSDSTFNGENPVIGPNDLKLMKRLAKAGSVEGKYRRMIVVYVDILAPLYWWKEFDTYKVGTVANSCSTMHKIHEREFTLDDFSHEHLDYRTGSTLYILDQVIVELNYWRKAYLDTKSKEHWWQIIQLLPSSYNQRRTIMLNYEVLANIYRNRRNHKLDEWRAFCKWIEELPYSELITGEREETTEKPDLTYGDLYRIFKEKKPKIGVMDYRPYQKAKNAITVWINQYDGQEIGVVIKAVYRYILKIDDFEVIDGPIFTNKE